MEINIITSYPEKGTIHSQKTVGVASYTKNLLYNIKKINPKIKINVYAEVLTNKSDYEENGVKVKRIWRRNDLKSLINLFIKIIKDRNKILLVSYEINMVGRIFLNAVFFSLFLLAKLNEIKIFFISHQVVINFKELEKNKIKANIFNVFKNILYRYISFLSEKIIVFEDKFIDIFPDKNKVVVIPHAVENFKSINKNVMRNKLRLKENGLYLLYFGYLSPYKGIDNLIDLIPNNTNLIIAGGINPNHKKNKTHQKYFNLIKTRSKKSNIIFTDFIDEKLIPYYFSSSDFVILPYKVFFSSSGPLSLAFAFEKPVLLSKPLEGYFESKDFQEALRESGLKKEELLFDLNEKSFAKRLDWARKNIGKLTLFSRLMKQKRSWKRVGRKYLEILLN